MTAETVKALAAECGFELAGIAPAEAAREYAFYTDWVNSGFAGEMAYLAGGRGALRADARNLLASVRSIICVGKLYNGPEPYSSRFAAPERAWISRYAWGEDYHRVLRRGLKRLAARLAEHTPEAFEWRAAVDTAPLLERAYASRAGLGWIGKNTCLISQHSGSWFFLGELLVSLAMEADAPPPDRCGSCTRCIDACPTGAIVPAGPRWAIDSRACISYFTIELRGPVAPEWRARVGNHVFGCDICQDVCPWNRRAPTGCDPEFAPRHFAPPLETLAGISEEEFRAMFQSTPVTRASYAGFLRNVSIAMGNARSERFRLPLERLAASEDPMVAAHARWALEQLGDA